MDRYKHWFFFYLIGGRGHGGGLHTNDRYVTELEAVKLLLEFMNEMEEETGEKCVLRDYKMISTDEGLAQGFRDDS